MNKTAVREFVAPETSVAPGEVLVVTEVGSPAFGQLQCPAAPLVGGTLHRRGQRTRFAAVRRCEDPAQDDGASLYLATRQQPDGSAAAIAAAAAATDRVAAAAARAAVQEWAAVLGTRRLLTGPGPWCSGAARALRMAGREVAENAGPDGQSQVHVLGQLAGSPAEIAELRQRGAVFADSLDDIPAGGTVIFPAHGVAAAVRAEAAERGLNVVDATCPLVASIHAEASRLAGRGDQLVLIGHPGHAAAAGLAGQAPGRTTAAGTPAGAAALRVDDPRRVSYLLQPGTPVEETAPVVTALRSRFPALRDPQAGAACYAASDRAETIRAIASGCDAVLVLGSAGSADAASLAGLARSRGARAHVISEVSDIVPGMLAGVTAIGLAEATSASPGLTGRVITALSGLGPLSVLRRQVRTEIAEPPEPQAAACS
jgi:4-hydroxy-3-methylbut-2-en-1-yl diphosphate reductase